MFCSWACGAPAAADADAGRQVAHGWAARLQGSSSSKHGGMAGLLACRPHGGCIATKGSAMLLNPSCSSTCHREQGSCLLQAACVRLPAAPLPQETVSCSLACRQQRQQRLGTGCLSTQATIGLTASAGTEGLFGLLCSTSKCRTQTSRVSSRVSPCAVLSPAVVPHSLRLPCPAPAAVTL